MAWFEIMAEDGTITRMGVDEDSFKIGRAGDNDLSLAEPSVSAQHCVIAKVGESWILRDLDSTNGTQVNGAKVREWSLSPGDLIAIGSKRIIFRDLGDTPAPADSPTTIEDTVRLSGSTGPAVGFEQKRDSSRWLWRGVFCVVLVTALAALVWFFSNLRR
jgi:pSer/pThr/pTyr-binding forkhead associated (FHA) protein